VRFCQIANSNERDLFMSRDFTAKSRRNTRDVHCLSIRVAIALLVVSTVVSVLHAQVTTADLVGTVTDS